MRLYQQLRFGDFIFHLFGKVEVEGAAGIMMIEALCISSRTSQLVGQAKVRTIPTGRVSSRRRSSRHLDHRGTSVHNKFNGMDH